MNPHRTQPIEIQPGRRARRRAAQRRRFIQHLLASFILAGTALMLVLFFSQPIEPPMVESTLPDKPTEEEEEAHGLDMAKEQVLAPVAAESRSRGAQSAADGRTAPGGSSSTGQPPPSILTVSSAPPVDEPPRTPAAPNDAPTPADDDEDETRPPVETNTQDPPAEDQQPELSEEVCWQGWSYDEERQECVRAEDLVPPEKGEEAAEEEQEQPEETTEPGVGNDLGGGIRKGNGSVIERDDDGEH